ncbi:transglutaminase family protein [Xylophilus sp. GOD-11R]|uniref:transglutaminase-like domain-containing protein n=1 Tax=Xylophilus sp. GOD-11R TaxID=3089814 RepID=UPI00298D04B1|nr:transglutaminase family protein [Xylophilus sp. GOD-11R]WPB55520.1 transglutaminase family protein [Xylophilus sp. GOD-11R]
MSAVINPRPTVIRCDLEYEVATPSHFIFNIQCAYSADQYVAFEALTVDPLITLQTSWDPVTGNRIFRCNASPGTLRIRYDATVQISRNTDGGNDYESEVADVPDLVLPYLMPSRFCPSDTMSQEAQRLFGQVPRGRHRVDTICQWIRDNIAYRIGTSNPTTTALDAYEQQAGVCRDFAHLTITFCRALNIPARLVGGYCHFAEPPQDFHAVVEVWLGGRWVMFDPTLLALPENIVRVATGLDAKNTAFSTMYGTMLMSHMHIQVNHDGEPALDNPDPIQATVRRAGT